MDRDDDFPTLRPLVPGSCDRARGGPDAIDQKTPKGRGSPSGLSAGKETLSDGPGARVSYLPLNCQLQGHSICSFLIYRTQIIANKISFVKSSNRLRWGISCDQGAVKPQEWGYWGPLPTLQSAAQDRHGFFGDGRCGRQRAFQRLDTEGLAYECLQLVDIGAGVQCRFQRYPSL